MRILLSGGGTGGHVMPILALISELKSHFQGQGEKIEFLWLGSKTGPEKDFAQKNNIPYKAVACGKLRRYWSWQNFVDIFKIPIGIVQALFIISKFQPHILFGKGGFVSIPSVIACWFFRVPSLIHESDIVLGLANKLLLPFVTKIAVTFAQTKTELKRYKQKVCITGNPIRNEILSGSKKRGYRVLGLEYTKPTILVLGGSQGAQKINKVLLEALPHLLQRYQIIHLCGRANFNKIKLNISKNTKIKKKIKNYHLFSELFGEKYADALISADLVISRAGTNTLCEIACLGKPALLIPYPYAAGEHQTKNALFFKKADAAELVFEKDLDSKQLIIKINRLLTNQKRLEKLRINMSVLAGQIDKNAAKNIVKELIKLKK